MQNIIQITLGLFLIVIGCCSVPLGYAYIKAAFDRTEMKEYRIAYSFKGGEGAATYWVKDIGHNLPELQKRIEKDSNIENVGVSMWTEIP